MIEHHDHRTHSQSGKEPDTIEHEYIYIFILLLLLFYYIYMIQIYVYTYIYIYYFILYIVYPTDSRDISQVYPHKTVFDGDCLTSPTLLA